MRCRWMNSHGQVIVKPPPYRTINMPEVQTSSHGCLCLKLREALAGALTADAPLACSIFLCAPFGCSGGDARPSIPENFMKKLNRRVPPPWGDDMEEALEAQYEARRRRAVLSPDGRWSWRSRLFLKLGVIIALLLYGLLRRYF
jgi:hypothetical protein